MLRVFFFGRATWAGRPCGVIYLRVIRALFSPQTVTPTTAATFGYWGVKRIGWHPAHPTYQDTRRLIHHTSCMTARKNVLIWHSPAAWPLHRAVHTCAEWYPQKVGGTVFSVSPNSSAVSSPNATLFLHPGVLRWRLVFWCRFCLDTDALSWWPRALFFIWRKQNQVLSTKVSFLQLENFMDQLLIFSW